MVLAVSSLDGRAEYEAAARRQLRFEAQLSRVDLAALVDPVGGLEHRVGIAVDVGEGEAIVVGEYAQALPHLELTEAHQRDEAAAVVAKIQFAIDQEE